MIHMVFTTVFFIIPYVSSSLTKVLVDILKHKNIYQAVIFNCNVTIADQVLSYHTMNNFGIMLSYKSTISNQTDFSSNFHKQGVVLHSSCQEWDTIFQDKTTLFRSPYSWFIFTENLSLASHSLSQLPIEVNSDFTVLKRIGHNMYEIHEVYNTGFHTKGHFVIKSSGYWDNSKLTVENVKRSNLSGVVLKCMVVITENIAHETIEQYVEKSRHTGFDTLHKLKYFTMLKFLRDMYKFR